MTKKIYQRKLHRFPIKAEKHEKIWLHNRHIEKREWKKIGTNWFYIFNRYTCQWAPALSCLLFLFNPYLNFFFQTEKKKGICAVFPLRLFNISSCRKKFYIGEPTDIFKVYFSEPPFFYKAEWQYEWDFWISINPVTTSTIWKLPRMKWHLIQKAIIYKDTAYYATQ